MASKALPAPLTLPGTSPPAPAVMAILNRFNRTELGNAIEVLVALLDVWDGDSDLEENDAEDSFELSEWARAQAKGPGCNVSDPDKGVEDDGEQTRDEDDWYDFGRAGPGCPISDPDGQYGEV